MTKPYPPISYNEYLKIPELLTLQSPRSAQFNRPSHDETLFIVVHQVYELWFKQILCELNSAMAVFSESTADDRSMGSVVSRLERIVAIQRLLIDQITVLETMTALDFLEFRSFIFPASGFQSAQFREIENKLGLRREARLPFSSEPYTAHVAAEDRARVEATEESPSLFDLIERWLERTPFLESDSFQFWSEYRRAVQHSFDRDREFLMQNEIINDESRARGKADINAAERSFDTLFDEALFEAARASGQWRLSHKAIRACLLIRLYRDQPVLHLPHLLLTALQDIDENFTQWRYRHALMAQRMLGSKIGTGGSTGAGYLRAATDKHRIFSDLTNLATFLIPRSELPALGEHARRNLGFHYESAGLPILS